MDDKALFVQKTHKLLEAPFIEPTIVNDTHYIGYFIPCSEETDYSLPIANCLFQDAYGYALSFAENYCHCYNRVPPNFQKVMVAVAYRHLVVLGLEDDKLINTFAEITRNLRDRDSKIDAVSFILINIWYLVLDNTYQDDFIKLCEDALFNF